ncbi:hypothetical protein [Hymenobacter crusticola]|uniref:Uncharacterized protein n=1 Tax=Hymenobacter crusticola TaxID=1770526 RepID=A0A243WA31_9BACT|nr:hypothetical protein [Hymenobacter crusticola]OUJ72417.1 hypothetical protein BXP70_17780 [Hymenobacter crusticola]
MTRAFAWFLSALILLQTFSQELMVLDYQVHKERITELFCVNKAKPQLHCNGKCHLAKQLRKAADAESKAPVGFAKVKYEAVAPLASLVSAPIWWPSVSPQYALPVAAAYAFTPAHSIFHPPSLQV